MELVRLRITHAFVRDRIRLGWREVLFGLKEELLDSLAPSNLAADQLAREDSEDSTLIRLAGLGTNDDALPFVEELAGREPEESIQEIRAKWLCLVMAWIYHHRYKYAEPLATVEQVYADFDYPEQIANLVRYMPAPQHEPPSANYELNEARLYERWRAYLEKCSLTHVARLAD